METPRRIRMDPGTLAQQERDRLTNGDRTVWNALGQLGQRLSWLVETVETARKALGEVNKLAARAAGRVGEQEARIAELAGKCGTVFAAVDAAKSLLGDFKRRLDDFEDNGAKKLDTLARISGRHKERHDALEARVAELDARLAALEEWKRDLPSLEARLRAVEPPRYRTVPLPGQRPAALSREEQIRREEAIAPLRTAAEELARIRAATDVKNLGE